MDTTGMISNLNFPTFIQCQFLRWASHAEGCAENLCGDKCEHCASGVDPVCNESVEQNCVACVSLTIIICSFNNFN